MSKQLLYERFTFTREDVRKNIALYFRAGQACDRLVIRLKYGPKAIRAPEIIMPLIEKCVTAYFPPGSRLTREDMQEFDQLLNFVTLSADRNGEYVGCAHRHPPEQTLYLSQHDSSWGFMPAEASGDWRLVLHVHAVIAGTVDYQVAVYGLGRGESDDKIPAL